MQTLLAMRPALRSLWRGFKTWRSHTDWSRIDPIASRDGASALLEYFKQHGEGPGIWKFIHYFPIYEHYFSAFRGKETHVLEIGIYSGGSLQMWREYFGARSTVYGVDIEPRCKAYESDAIRVFIGDQADRHFWNNIKKQVPLLDIVIDDGGHMPEQQIATFEELLPCLRPGGVYLCEDITNPFNLFSTYLCGMAQNLNSIELHARLDDNERRQVCAAHPLQSAVSAIHFHPFCAVIERSANTVSEFIAPKHGSNWEPFLE